MESSFQGKRALVTGAGKGIGRAIAIKLASLGAHVIGLSRTQSDLDSLKAECATLQTCLLDISHWDKTRETIENIGHVDLLVNNAAVVMNKPFLETTKEEFDRVHETNFGAAYNITQVVARSMVAKGTGGAIVNISSLASIRAYPGMFAYSSAKAGLDMLTKTLALELGPSKIRVNTVSPSFVLTEMGKKMQVKYPETVERVAASTPLGKIAEVEDVVNTVVFLLSDQAAMINGVIMPVDGGITIKCI